MSEAAVADAPVSAEQSHTDNTTSGNDRVTGTVKWFNDAKGFGFIQREGCGDIFVHFRSIHGEGFRSLKEGQHVEFEIKKTEKGLQAESVVGM